MPRHIIACGEPRHMGGWRAPLPHQRLFAAANDLGGAGRPKTPQEKGFTVLEACQFYDLVKRIEDQAWVGCCTAEAWTSAIEILRRALGLPDHEFSVLHFYAGERTRIMHVPLSEDSGASITDGAMFLAKFGVSREEFWPWAIEKWALDPPQSAWDDAAQHQGVRTYALSTMEWIKAALSIRRPVVHGFSVPEHFAVDTARTGQLRMPEQGERFVGGHAICRIGFDIHHDNGDGTTGATLELNSWSAGFGLKDFPGCFWMPFGYHEGLLDLDDWSPHEVEAGP